MDKLFKYTPDEAIEHLLSVEDEMIEEYYNDFADFSFILEDLREEAQNYIRPIFNYIQRHFKEEEATVLSMLKELYHIAVTGEYMHLLDASDKFNNKDVYASMEGESGHQKVLYAARLLRYYYLVSQDWKDHPTLLEETDNLLDKFEVLDPLRKKTAAKSNDLSKAQKTPGDVHFMASLFHHMNQYYVGQDHLKKKLCSVLYQWKYHNVRTTLLMIGPSGSGKNYIIEVIRSFSKLDIPIVTYDCSSLTPNGFEGSSVKDIFRKVNQCKTNSDGKYILYLDEADKIINANHDSRGESVNGMVQQQLLSALAGTETIAGVDTSKVLFILGGAFPRIDDLKRERKTVGFVPEPDCLMEAFKSSDTLRDQLHAIGGEVEFIGRINEIVRLNRLSRENLRSILMDDAIGVFPKKRKLYQNAGLHLEMEDNVVEHILDLIVKENAGARSVTNVINHFTDNQYFFDMLVNGFDTMVIHKGMLLGEAPTMMKRR